MACLFWCFAEAAPALVKVLQVATPGLLTTGIRAYSGYSQEMMLTRKTRILKEPDNSRVNTIHDAVAISLPIFKIKQIHHNEFTNNASQMAR